jgi:alpha-tubulin suppressor-like RCC1 family protein
MASTTMKAILTLHVLCFMSVDGRFLPTIHHSRPGTTLTIREGNDLNTRGIALIKAGGFVVRKGPTGGTDLDGWEVPTDGNYTRTYSNWDSWVATKENGEIYCWGSALSIKSCPVSKCTTPTCTEADVASYYPKPIKYIYSCKRSYCALYVDKTVFCWMAGYGPTQEPSPPGKGWVTATSNDFGYSFLNEDGSVWSRNIGGTEVTWIDTPPSGEERFLSLHSAGNVFAGLTDTGRIAAWGLARYYGEILGESRQTMNVKMSGYGKAVSGVPAEGYYTAIRAGKDSFCALWVNGTVNGAIHCWGATKKRIGDTTASGLCPSSICRRPTDDGYVSLHSNHYSYVAVKADGTIYPFGDKTYGGLLPQSGGAHAVQGPVYAGNFLHDVSYVVSSMSAHVAVFNNGTLACWGYEGYGGANFYHGRTGCPSGSGFTNVSASERGFAALDPAGAVISWGQWGNQRLARTTNSSDEWGLDGFVRLWMQRWEFLAQKADGTIVYFGKRSSDINAAYFPEPTMDTDRCQHNPRTRASCTWSEADIAETSWVLCKSKGNYNAVNLGIGEDAECGGGATPGDPLVSINKFKYILPRKMHSYPGQVMGNKDGNSPNSWGTAFLKTGGFVTRTGIDNGIQDFGWVGPTDGNYTRIYQNKAAWVAVKDNGELFCWGAHSSGRVGCPALGCTASTCTAAGVDSYYPKPIKYIFASDYGFCALYEDTTVYCWQDGGSGDEPSPPGSGWVTAVVASISMRTVFSFLNEDGSVWCANVGWSETITNPAPTSGNHIALHATQKSFVGLTDTGRISNWGPITYYADGAPRNGVGYYVSIKASYDSFCALWVHEEAGIDGKIHCWGATASYHGGTAASTEPRPTNDGYVSLYSNQYSYVAVNASGSIFPFGAQTLGGLIPVSISPDNSLHDVVRVVSNIKAYVAVHSDGSLTCWGWWASGGARANGDTECPLGPNYTQVSSSKKGFAAIDSIGAVITWGIYGTRNGLEARRSSNEVGLTGFVRLYVGTATGSDIVAQRADGTIMPFGKAHTSNTAYYPEPILNRKKCHVTHSYPACQWSEEDKVETGWMLGCTKGGFSSHNKLVGDDECGGVGDPYAIVNKLQTTETPTTTTTPSASPTAAPSPSASPITADSESEDGSTDIGAGVGEPTVFPSTSPSTEPTSPNASHFVEDSESEDGSTDIGAGVGLALGLVLALSGCFCCWWFFGAKRRKNKVHNEIVEARKAGSDDAWVAYASQTEAAKALGLEPTHVSECLSGKTQNTGGYEVRYGIGGELVAV